MFNTGLIFQETKGKMQQELNTYARQEFIRQNQLKSLYIHKI